MGFLQGQVRIANPGSSIPTGKRIIQKLFEARGKPCY
jgi:hypothetical protein